MVFAMLEATAVVRTSHLPEEPGDAFGPEVLRLWQKPPGSERNQGNRKL